MPFYTFDGGIMELHSTGNSYEVYDVESARDTELFIPNEYDGKPVNKIGNDAFKHFKGWRVIIPDTINAIGNYAFYKLENLRKIDFQYGSSLEVIGQSSFAFTSLKEIFIPKSVKVISNYAFSYSDLQKLTFENDSKLQAIGSCAFEHANLTSVSLSLKDTVIGHEAFSYNLYLESVDLQYSDNIELYPKVFYNCPKLKSVIPPTYGFSYYYNSFPPNIIKTIESSLLFS